MITPPSNISYSQRHKDIVNSKHKTIKGCANTTRTNLIGLENQIIARYSAFEDSITKNTLFNFPEETSLLTHTDDLLSCYKNRTSRVKAIFELIKNSQPRRFLSVCPYCGLTIPKTHDHYLPESRFPELAVHALNLIPCCGTCNETKNKYWKNDTHRIFLHFYSDVIPDIQYIYVTLHTVDTSAVGATFTIDRPDDIEDYIWEVLAAHYENLKLIYQYNETANDEISNIHNVCVAHLRCGGSSLRIFLQELLIPDEQLYGSNHWRVVLMKSLSTSTAFFKCVNAAI